MTSIEIVTPYCSIGTEEAEPVAASGWNKWPPCLSA